ncbi:MAG: V-type ATP synthase subunit E [Thermoplasmata archaeon]|nr:MAG: V-type ATP synthase subunit E [Thermoplasmata archaeon]
MSLDTILERIRSDANAEAARIIKAGRNESAKVKHRFGIELQEMDEKERAQHETKIRELRNVHLANAHRTARQIKLLAEEELIDQCFVIIKESLTDIRGEVYNASLRTLVLDGLQLLGGAGRVQVVRNEDIEVIAKIQSELDVAKKLELDNNLLPAESLGGVLITSLDGKTIVDNTFKAVLERKKDQYRVEIAKKLFEG